MKRWRVRIWRASSALDLGTGGGERLLRYKDVFPATMAATEGYVPNFHLARGRLAPYGVTVYESDSSLVEVLPIADESFDLVLSRHTAFNAGEVARILTQDGILLTQQVDGRTTDMHTAFGVTAQWPQFTLDFLLGRLHGLPYAIELAEEWTGEVRFTDVGAVVYYLKAVPWLVPRFTVETHLSYLEELGRRLEAKGELIFHQTLMLLRARKQ